MRMFLKVFVAAVAFVNLSCDDGRIYEEYVSVPETGRVVKVTGMLSGAADWSAGYSVVVAGFNDEKDYAIITKSVPAADCSEIVISGISDDVTRIELCVVNRLRKRIVTYRSYECPFTADTIRLDAGTINLGMFSTLQNQLFNTTCANCHGASTHAAAGLFLTEGRSYGAIINKPSAKVEGCLLVLPGNADESVLYQTLATKISETWNYDHTKEILSDDMLEVMEDWINDGARQ